eukprot:s1639_g10.t1
MENHAVLSEDQHGVWGGVSNADPPELQWSNGLLAEGHYFVTVESWPQGSGLLNLDWLQDLEAPIPRMSRPLVLAAPLIPPLLSHPTALRSLRWLRVRPHSAWPAATCVAAIRGRLTRGMGGKGKGVSKGSGKDVGSGKGGGKGPQKPTDDPDFVRWSKGMRLEGSSTGAIYVVEDYVSSGSFSRVFRVSAQKAKRRWGKGEKDDEGATIFAAKVMRKEDSYIQYTSSGPREGDLLQRLEAQQREANLEPLTMRCFDSFATKDDAGKEMKMVYWCLILEWLDASLFDAVKANRNRGLHLSMVRILLRQLLEQLKVLQELGCTHTDIKHKNCCLANTEYYMAASAGGPTMILTEPLAKFIDYGNAVFEGDKKPHPIHTKQFRAPEVLLNIREGWGPPSDIWTLGVTGCFLVSGQLVFNSHDPQELVRLMTAACGPFPARLLGAAQDARMRRAAENAQAGDGWGCPKTGAILEFLFEHEIVSAQGRL